MKETTALILQGTGYGIAIDPSAETTKLRILKESELIIEVNDPTACAAARIQLDQLSSMRILVEKSRTEVKKPVLQVGRDIDSKAAEFVADILLAEARVRKLMEDYAAKVEVERQRILREMEAKRREEERIAREAAEEVRKAEEARIKAENEAAAARRAAEEAEWNAKTPEEEAQAAAAAEAAKLAQMAADKERQEAAARAAAACDASLAAPSAPVMVPEKVKGAKMVTDFTVTDLDALYHHDANLVAMSPRRMEILQAIERMTVGDELPAIPGLNIFRKPQVR